MTSALMIENSDLKKRIA